MSNSEHLLEDLTNGRQRVEPALLHVVEEAAQLRVVAHGQLEVPAGAGGGDLEHLGGEVRAAATLELTVGLEPGTMLGDLLPELLDALAAHRLGEHDRRRPALVRAEREHLPHLVQHRLRHRVVQLVDRDHVGDLHDPGLQRLNRVARAGHQREHDGVGDREHADLALPRADGLEEDDILARRVEHEQRLQRRLGETAGVAARPHRADEDVGIEEVVGQADPVAEQRALRERARGIDRDHADGLARARGRAGSATRSDSTCRRRAGP